MNLTPEERQRIYEEEKARVEARAQIEREQRNELRRQAAAQRVIQFNKYRSKIIVLACILLAVGTVAALKIRTAILNAELITGLREAEATLETLPSDEDWRFCYSQAAENHVKERRRAAALLYMKSSSYAVNANRRAASYQGVAELGMADAAETYFRKSVELNPDDVFAQRELADVLVEMERYTEAEPIYIHVVSATSDPEDRRFIYSDLEKIMRATHREAQADAYKKRSDEEWDASIKQRSK